MKISQSAKALTALLTGALAWGSSVVASPSGSITAPEWLVLAGVGVAAALTWLVPNTNPPTP